MKMPPSNVQSALELEELQRQRAIREIHKQFRAEDAQTAFDGRRRGVTGDGGFGRQIARIYAREAYALIDRFVEIRRDALSRTPELASVELSKAFLEVLETEAKRIIWRIPERLRQSGTPTVERGLSPSDNAEIARLIDYASREVDILNKEFELSRIEQERHHSLPESKDKRKVFVVHGRNAKARNAMFAFLRSINLNPIEWGEALAMTGKATPYVGEVLDTAFSEAQAVVVLVTGDDVARLGTRYAEPNDPPEETEPTPQARPNVLFEAGMAMGRSPERTVIVVLGKTRPFSDIFGRHILYISNDPKRRQGLADRLRTAGCDVVTEHRQDWHNEGDFDGANEPPDNRTE